MKLMDSLKALCHGAFFSACALFALASVARAEMIAHELSIVLEPDSARLMVEDRVTLPAPIPPEGARFRLHEGLAPTVAEPGAELGAVPREGGDEPWAQGYRIRLPAGERTFTLRYGGVLTHELSPVSKEYARGFTTTPGIISADGAVLSASSLWFPVFGEENTTFKLAVDLPAGWDAVSQGELGERREAGGRMRVSWSSDKPGDDIYLIAAKFTRYSQRAGKVEAYAYLRSPDQALASKFLDATGQYVAMYDKLIGPYPFTKFALVENFWETGFGMPSFTLLGPKVIRFPFILRSSYPHEILHNWWGNSVYVDYSAGNWAEGLTAYLSDHLMREQSGAGHEYREATLQKYADYVAEKADAPLTAFVSRHSSSSEALGYGKSLMVFHMLRTELGDAKFAEGLARFYADNRWKRASWTDLRMAFEAVAGRELGWFFRQWVERAGAPVLALEDAKAEGAGPWRVSGAVRQTQVGEPYRLKVPVAVTLEGRREAELVWVECEGARTDFAAEFAARPLRIDVDPFFEVFRLLGREEIPPALSGALGANPQTVIVPSAATGALKAEYEALAKSLKDSSEGEAAIINDAEAQKALPTGALWILGWENSFLGRVKEALARYPAAFGEAEVSLGSATLPTKDHSFVATGEAGGAQVTLVASDTAAALPGLARKLPHYGKYSYLAFEGGEPVNVAKGRWDAVGSRLTAFFTPNAQRGATPSRPQLAQLPPVFSTERMSGTVALLSAPEYGGRGAGSEGLDKAAEYVAGKMREAGLKPGIGADWYAPFEAEVEGGAKARLKNVVGVVAGTKAEYSGQAVVVGAHYDHLGLGWPDAKSGNRGKIHPGADDNGSGVAVLLELARRIAANPPERTVVFVAFAGEELGRVGSKAFLAGNLPWPKEKMFGMVNLDTVGRLGDGKILFLGSSSAREWIHIANGAGFVTGAKVEAVAKDIGSSDQASFIEAGVPAVQLFTGAHADYHSPGDTPDKLDIAGLAVVAQVAFEAVDYLSRREAPLTSTLSGATAPATPPAKEGSRKVSLGTVPDFAYAGEGVRVGEVTAGSPAEKAGLKAGDVIAAVNGEKVSDLKGFSAILKKLSPGSSVDVEYLRGAERNTVEVKVVER